ncbi:MULTISPECIES: hypothetical protein [Larkinella]|uniref:Uncharacterized protein n=1 Tax=Larkinella humicola TaxID=2607654 RepID=A0A5N1JL71_9BACT|nr:MULTISPECIES: hypothetical protein [Larkinella]KAA9356871.1 hypothetical protein F0P93_03780 [Larkinella humicola]
MSTDANYVPGSEDATPKANFEQTVGQNLPGFLPNPIGGAGGEFEITIDAQPGPNGEDSPAVVLHYALALYHQRLLTEIKDVLQFQEWSERGPADSQEILGIVRKLKIVANTMDCLADGTYLRLREMYCQLTNLLPSPNQPVDQTADSTKK